MCVMLLFASRASRSRAFSMPRRWSGVGHAEPGGQGQDAGALAVVVALGQVLVQDAADAGLGGDVGWAAHADSRVVVLFSRRNAVISARRASSRCRSRAGREASRRSMRSISRCQAAVLAGVRATLRQARGF